MRQSFGETRSKFRDNHALISPDSHERTTLPNWPGVDLVFTIAPQMGAKFSQYFAYLTAGTSGHEPLPAFERFIFVLAGEVSLIIEEQTYQLTEEGYAIIPADTAHTISSVDQDAILVILERLFVQLPGQEKPAAYIGNCKEVSAVPMKGDDRLMLKKLLPQDIAYDCEVNVMDFSPGASLPYVETHFMEHGLVFLNGGGVYRLDDCWYPVDQHDTIWMGPYCPQWFGAIGQNNARYLIYKNWNRDPHAF